MTDTPNPPQDNVPPSVPPGGSVPPGSVPGATPGAVPPGATPGAVPPGAGMPGPTMSYATASVPTPAPGTPADPVDVEKNKVYAILAYFGLLFLVPLLAAKDSPFARFHANQGLNVCILTAAIVLVSMLGSCLLTAVTAWVGGIGGCLCIPFYFVPLIWSVLGIINAVNGQMKALPLIGNITLIK